MKKFWRKYHKWVGLFFTFFILMFCFSGIILNHRNVFSESEISRYWMPKDYHYENWNNGIIRGTMPLPNKKVLCYGNTGIWQTDSCFSVFTPWNEGLQKGIDNRKISNIISLPDGSIWTAGLYQLYKLSEEQNEWLLQEVNKNKERIADVSHRGDTLVVLTRSHIYEALPPYHKFNCYELSEPKGYKPEVSLFRTVWLLHSGELFGLAGQLFVDSMAVVIIILCITGFIFYFFPSIIKRRKRSKKGTKTVTDTLRISTKWHFKLGTWLIIPTVILAATGMCLRPPLMIPLAITSIKPLPGSSMDSDNPWHDKFRGIRWDSALNEWLISTSAGFYQVKDFTSTPEPITKAPPVSPMGINVFQTNQSGEWLIGSFSGIFRWNRETGEITDYLTDQPYDESKLQFFGTATVSGFSADIGKNKEYVFDYSEGARTKEGTVQLSAMPQEMKDQPMSLWNFALELHVGRCYTPFLGPVSVLFVFLAGLLLTLTLISGYILRPGKKKKKK